MICLDTNVLIDILREDTDTSELEERLEKEDVCITAVTLFELWCGVLMRGSEREIRIISAIADAFDVLSLDKEASRLSAEIYVSSKRSGFEIPPLDALIAGIAKRHGVKLGTRDRQFSRVDGLEVVFL